MDFVLYFHCVMHEFDSRFSLWKLNNLNLRDSSPKEFKGTYGHRIIHGFQQISVPCKTKQESFDADTDSNLVMCEKWQWHKMLFKWNFRK